MKLWAKGLFAQLYRVLTSQEGNKMLLKVASCFQKKFQNLQTEKENMLIY